MNDKHTFALYFEKLVPLKQASLTLKIKDYTTIERITKILRLSKGDPLIIFNQKIAYEVVLGTITGQRRRQELQTSITNIIELPKERPAITLYQCVTQRQQYESIIYSGTQMGVSAIIPVVSKKSISTAKLITAEPDRFKKICIAAAEQSKQFSLPDLLPPMILGSIPPIEASKELGVYLEATGKPLQNIDSQNNKETIHFLVGPEGGLTSAEFQILEDKGFTGYKINNNILRSKDAALVGLGIIRNQYL